MSATLTGPFYYSCYISLVMSNIKHLYFGTLLKAELLFYKVISHSTIYTITYRI